MKLPNGYGSVHKLSGNRRKPWRARKTAGWEFDPVDLTTKQKYVTIGYFSTKAEALQALADYNANPYDLSSNTITFEEVYDRWSEEHFKKIVPSACRTWKSAFKYCQPLYKMRMRDIRVNHLENTIKNADIGDNTKSRMKSLFNQMYKYAMKYEIVDKDYAALCDSVKKPKPQIVRIPFSDTEIQKLWDNIDLPFADMILIGIYTGFRPQELSILQIENINFQQRTIMGGLKTDAGRNRIVPIHPVIWELVQKNYDWAKEINSTYLFNDEYGQQGTYMTYDKYRRRFDKVMKRLNLEHRPHDTRHTFVTKAKAAGMDEYILKLIVGHAIKDITEKIYTHRTIEDMQREIKKIK
jgi:integrase